MPALEKIAYDIVYRTGLTRGRTATTNDLEEAATAAVTTQGLQLRAGRVHCGEPQWASADLTTNADAPEPELDARARVHTDYGRKRHARIPEKMPTPRPNSGAKTCDWNVNAWSRLGTPCRSLRDHVMTDTSSDNLFANH